MTSTLHSGGCQCGAIRFQAGKLGRPSICHCRMCQKATGGLFAALVTADQAHLAWTRGQPLLFRSSKKVHRGFCGRCGTPVSYHHPGGVELMIGAFDHPEMLEPQVHINKSKGLPWIDHLHEKPDATTPEMEEYFAGIVSFQHPDHDTAAWPPEDTADDK